MSIDPRHLTFAQRMGAAPMPTQALAGTIEESTRARLWVVILDWLVSTARGGYLHDAVRGPAANSLLRWWVVDQHRLVDEIPSTYAKWQQTLRKEIQGDYLKVYNLVQFLLLDPDFRQNKAIAECLEDTRAAYRVVDDLLMPLVSDEETATIERALSDIEHHAASGAKAHMREAASQLTSGQWAGSVHESVSAVESAARFICGDDKAILSVLAKQMRANGMIGHKCLQDAILKVYGYASDEKGVRHSQGALESQNVTEREALFLFGMAASMVSYLLNSSVSTA